MKFIHTKGRNIKNKMILAVGTVLLLILIFLNIRIIDLLNDVSSLSERYRFDDPYTEQVHPIYVLIIPEKYSIKWASLKRGALYAADKLHVTLSTVEMEQYSVNELQKQIEIVIASRASGIIMDSLYYKDCIELIAKSHEKNIPVVIVNSSMIKNDLLITVGNNYYKEGTDAADIIIKNAASGGRIGVICNENSTVDEMERINGFLTELKTAKGIDIIDIVNAAGDSSMLEFHIEHCIENTPELIGFFAVNQDLTVKTAQIMEKSDSAGSIALVGIGNEYKVLAYIREGIITASFIQDHYRIGEFSIRKIIENNIKEEVLKTYYIKPIVIHKGNVDLTISK